MHPFGTQLQSVMSSQHQKQQASPASAPTTNLSPSTTSPPSAHSANTPTSFTAPGGPFGHLDPMLAYRASAFAAQSGAQTPRFLHEEPKPQHSYIGLIAMAILSVPDRKMVLSDIYQWILDNYPYFRSRGPGWRNSIRHNLSLNDCFQKAGRSANGKGHFWGIHPANLDDFKRGDFRRRRAQRKVRRHMGLSVDDDEDSDDSPCASPLAANLPFLLAARQFPFGAPFSMPGASMGGLPMPFPFNQYAAMAAASHMQQQQQQQGLQAPPQFPPGFSNLLAAARAQQEQTQRDNTSNVAASSSQVSPTESSGSSNSPATSTAADTADTPPAHTRKRPATGAAFDVASLLGNLLNNHKRANLDTNNTAANALKCSPPAATVVTQQSQGLPISPPQWNPSLFAGAPWSALLASCQMPPAPLGMCLAPAATISSASSGQSAPIKTDIAPHKKDIKSESSEPETSPDRSDSPSRAAQWHQAFAKIQARSYSQRPSHMDKMKAHELKTENKQALMAKD